jgi:hypothetical protein
MPINPVPPPERHIILVGFGHFDNGRSCEVHPGGCGDALVLSKEDFGVGMLLRIHNSIPNELAVHVIKKDGTNGCRVVFAKREYATEENVQKYDGVYCAFGQCLYQVPRKPILPPPCPQELCLR